MSDIQLLNGLQLNTYIGNGITTQIVGGVVNSGGGGGGTGNVNGPASSTDNAIARFDSTTGKIIQNSSVTVDDNGNIATSGTVDGRDVSADGSKLDGIESGAEVNNISDTDAADLTGGGITTIHQHNADDIAVDNTNFGVLYETETQSVVEQVDQALRNARGTGILYGGNLTDLGSGVVRIGNGVGGILDNTDPQNPIYYNTEIDGSLGVYWSQTDINLSATDGVYYIYVDNTGTVQSTMTEPTHPDYRTDIWLWRVSIRSGLVSGTASIVQPLQQYGPQIWDVWRAYGAVKNGLVLSPNSTNLTVAMSAGEVYLPGSNFFTDPTEPHETSLSAQSPVTFRHVLRDGTQSADITSLDVGNYDNAGVITAIPGTASRATIFTWYLFPTANNHRVLYGQTIYNTVAEALTALQSGTYNPVVPANYENAIIIGWVIAQKGATNLADGTQVFVTSNKFGLIGGGVATSGAGALLAINNLSDLASASTARTNLGVYSTTDTDNLFSTRTWRASDYPNVKAWVYDPAIISNVTTLTSGTQFVVRMYLPVASAINTLNCIVPNVGSPSQFYMTLYDDGGNLLAQSADVASTITSGTRWKDIPITSQNLSAGWYNVGFWGEGGSMPQLARSGSQPGTNGNLASSDLRWSISGTGLTTTAPATLSKVNTSSTFFAAMSLI